MVSVNVRGLINFKKRQAIFNWLKRLKYDIVFLQETHSTSLVEKQWENEWGNKTFFSHGSNNSRGVCILFKSGLDFAVNESIVDRQGRYIFLKVMVGDRPYNLLNVYAPNKTNEQVAFFQHIDRLIQGKCEGDEILDNLVLGGDFNMALDPMKDKKGGLAGGRNRANDELHNMARIPRSPFITPGILTDHSAIDIGFKKQHDENRGRGYWKLNSRFVTNNEYVTNLKERLQDWKQKEFSDHVKKWE